MASDEREAGDALLQRGRARESAEGHKRHAPDAGRACFNGAASSRTRSGRCGGTRRSEFAGFNGTAPRRARKASRSAMVFRASVVLQRSLALREGKTPARGRRGWNGNGRRDAPVHLGRLLAGFAGCIGPMLGPIVVAALGTLGSRETCHH